MRWPAIEDPPSALTSCFFTVSDEEGKLVPCPRPVAESRWVCQNNVWNCVDACEGHAVVLPEPAGGSAPAHASGGQYPESNNRPS